MRTEIKSLHEEQNYWKNRLNRMSKQINKKKKYKKNVLDPLSQTSFSTYNPNKPCPISRLQETGAFAFADEIDIKTMTTRGNQKYIAGESTSREDNPVLFDDNAGYRDTWDGLTPNKMDLKNDSLNPFSKNAGKNIFYIYFCI